MSMGFYGAGCPHVGVECLIAQLGKLMVHFGCSSNNGYMLKLSLELLIVEVGLCTQPLRLSYKKYGSRATWSWMTALWEKCDMFGVRVDFADSALRLPRQGDRWLMDVFEEAGFSRTEQDRLNRVRLHQQVVFLSDVRAGQQSDRRGRTSDCGNRPYDSLCLRLGCTKVWVTSQMRGIKFGTGDLTSLKIACCTLKGQ